MWRNPRAMESKVDNRSYSKTGNGYLSYLVLSYPCVS